MKDKHLLGKKKEQKPIRILHIIGKMSCDGAETFIMNVYRKIDKNQFQFDFIVHTQEKQFYDDEIERLGGIIYRLPRMSQHPLIYFKEFNKILKSKQYKIVHRHTASSIIFPELIIAKRNKIKKIIVHSHNTQASHKILHKLLRIVINKLATDRLACSKEAGQWLFGDKKNFTVIPNGIDFAKFEYSKDTAENQKKILRIENKFVIGHIGRFNKQKNHTFLIEIFHEICKKRKDVVLLLIGIGELQEEIQKKVKEYQLADKVIFLGNRNNVNELIQAMDVLLFPSLYEGLPLVLLEAQASGLRSVISDTITKEVEYTEGLLKRISLQDSIQKWANQVMIKEQKDRKKYNIIAIRSNFDINRTIEMIEKIYDINK